MSCARARVRSAQRAGSRQDKAAAAGVRRQSAAGDRSGRKFDVLPNVKEKGNTN